MPKVFIDFDEEYPFYRVYTKDLYISQRAQYAVDDAEKAKWTEEDTKTFATHAKK